MRRLIDLLTLDSLDRLIRLKSTGTPKDLSCRLRIPERSLYELIDYLRCKMRAPILYVKDIPSYVYDYPPRFYLGFEKDRLLPIKPKGMSERINTVNLHPSLIDEELDDHKTKSYICI